MLGRLIIGMIGGEIADAKRRVGGLVVILLALLLIVFSALIVLFAFYLWLSGIMPPWQAALVVAGCVFAAGLVIFLIGRSMMRRRVRSAERLEAEMQALMSQYSTGGDAPDEKKVYGLVAVAALTGLILGRRLTR